MIIMDKNLYVISNDQFLNEFTTVVVSKYEPDELLEIMYILEKYFNTLKDINSIEEKESFDNFLRGILVKAFSFEVTTKVFDKELNDVKEEKDVEEFAECLIFPDVFSMITTDDNEDEFGKELYQRYFKQNYHINFDKIVREKDKKTVDMKSIELKWKSNISVIKLFIKNKKEEELVFWKESKENILLKLKNEALSVNEFNELKEELSECEEIIDMLCDEINKL